MRAMKHRSKTGVDSMIGHPVEVLKRINPDGQGQVLVDGEIWNAQSERTLKKGERGEVIAVRGLTLQVEEAHQNHRNLSKKKVLVHNS
jgi:membrane-bound serine protease (ClpP class)